MDNKEYKHCGLNVALTILNGKWKPIILYNLFHHSEIRFTELWRIIPRVAKKVLLEQLKQLENDELIIRDQKSGFPPEVSYSISKKGRALEPVFEVLEAWANKYSPEKVEIFDKTAKNISGRLKTK
ncbi:winged helix-turn-helix transcriptional regulator [Mucilaginibacter sp. X4EP1]|jgi:DNA-binding HxlR family transcriptional regulator|uniref:winged helix-turn-helix transcriptional regulator n=1 Tax=Mucilaginibacter sp. X4EP1 TaxID=2723092 RepID=UPI002169B848|nr:helix-turn-helix domain-containing protein [Mucilaginibacter sp. X4EP1]MCS3812689.1 DNA-binding HxlR family transcriptional regulator [Mucilaginibacter sp. X4EP1]